MAPVLLSISLDDLDTIMAMFMIANFAEKRLRMTKDIFWHIRSKME